MSAVLVTVGHQIKPRMWALSNELFYYTEACCVVSYDSEEKLQLHFDTGKHIEQLERESTLEILG